MTDSIERTGHFFSIFYKDLRSVAHGLLARETRSHTLQPTALVNEAFLRLTGQKQATFQNKSHFLAVGAMMMRRVLIDRARRALSRKRSLGIFDGIDELSSEGLSSEELIDLDQALGKLAQLDPRQAQMIDLRFFAGLTVQELAETFQVSARTVEYDLQMAKAWLSREIHR